MALSALFYAGCLLIATLVNKTLLMDESPAPQLLSLFRMLATIILLWIGRRLKVVQFPPLHWRIVRTLLPLPVIYLSLMVTELIPTISLSRPMSAISRRFIAVVTMVLEEKLLGIQAPRLVQYSIITMTVGATISAAHDMPRFFFGSYIIILINNAISAANGVYLKKILDSEELNIWGLMYYDACFMIMPEFIVTWASGGFEGLKETLDSQLFWFNFLISYIMDALLTYGMMLCTQAHSALTVTAVSNLWSIFVSYFMLKVFGRIDLSWNLYLGMNISLTGAILYIYAYFAFRGRKVGTAARHTIHIKQDRSAKVDAKSLELLRL